MRRFQARGFLSRTKIAPQEQKSGGPSRLRASKPPHSKKRAAPGDPGPLPCVLSCFYQLMVIVIVFVAVVEPDVPVMVMGGVVPVMVMFSAPLLDAIVCVSPM